MRCPTIPRLLLALVAIALLASGCTRTMAIKTLLDDPGHYDGQVVRIAGQVTAALGVLGYGGYRVDDGTANIIVVTSKGGAPREGTEVGVEGTFRAAFTLGTETAAVIQEDQRFER